MTRRPGVVRDWHPPGRRSAYERVCICIWQNLVEYDKIKTVLSHRTEHESVGRLGLWTMTESDNRCRVFRLTDHFDDLHAGLGWYKPGADLFGLCSAWVHMSLAVDTCLPMSSVPAEMHSMTGVELLVCPGGGTNAKEEFCTRRIRHLTSKHCRARWCSSIRDRIASTLRLSLCLTVGPPGLAFGETLGSVSFSYSKAS